MLKNKKRVACPMRHENGNCLPAGGFCTAVNDCICEALHNAFYSGIATITNELIRQRKEKNADPPEIKCEKCEHYKPIEKHTGHCTRYNIPAHETGGCREGKEKGGGIT